MRFSERLATVLAGMDDVSNESCPASDSSAAFCYNYTIQWWIMKENTIH